MLARGRKKCVQKTTTRLDSVSETVKHAEVMMESTVSTMVTWRIDSMSTQINGLT